MRRTLRIAVIVLLFIAVGMGAFAGTLYLDYHRDLPLQQQSGPVGLWLEHRWVGETQSIAGYDALADELRGLGITDVFAHVGPLDGTGAIPPERYPNAAAFVAAMHARLPGVHIQAWMGQMEKRRGGPLDLADPSTRAGILRTAEIFLDLGFDGIHYDIESLQRDDSALHALLDATHALARARGRLLSLATTEIEPFAGANALVNTPLPDAVLWSPSDYRAAAARVDQLAVMTYNTALPWDWLYGSFVAFETRRIVAAVDGKAAIMMGVPTYEEPGWTFHPQAENMASGLRGVRLAIADAGPRPAQLGVAIYAHWTTDATEWATYRRLWRGGP
jgi:hypothetical protein